MSEQTHVEIPQELERATNAIVTVGPKENLGRGFIIEVMDENPIADWKPVQLAGEVCRFPRFIPRRIIVTAAHCLPDQPPAAAIVGVEEKTYPDLIGASGDDVPSIMAECLFVDPVSDLAILGEPDYQLWSEASEAYLQLVEQRYPLTVATNPIKGDVRGWLLSLDGRWNPCIVKCNHNLWITEARQGIIGGMSGSPILLDDGHVIGVLCSSSGTSGTMHCEGGPQPRLSHCLPGWLLQASWWRTDNEGRGET